MSEDEFVVLAEHAGLVDAFDGSADRECVERRQLLRWLEYEGAALFYDRMLAPPSADGNGSDDGEKASIARAVLDRMIEKQWLTPLASDHVHEGLQGDGSEPSQLYLLRMSTTDAYRIYIEKDAESTVSSRSWSGRSLLDAMRHEQNATATTPSNSSATSSQDDHSVPDAMRQRRIREKMWQDCFPTCSESCKQLFFSFTSPTVVLYASLGLNLIGNGISSVPAFSRELRSMQISHEDRTVVIGFLARAFPTE